MNILITGAKGFVGRNLTAALQNIKDGKDKTHPELEIGELYLYDIDTAPALLDTYCEKADFVIHFAGVNRPENPEDFMKGKVTLIGCSKLDMVDYTDKLTEIISNNDIKSVTVVRMEVPCCGGIENAVKRALLESGKFIPWQVITITTDGKILE